MSITKPCVGCNQMVILRLIWCHDKFVLFWLKLGTVFDVLIFFFLYKISTFIANVLSSPDTYKFLGWGQISLCTDPLKDYITYCWFNFPHENGNLGNCLILSGFFFSALFVIMRKKKKNLKFMLPGHIKHEKSYQNCSQSIMTACPDF